MIEELYTLHKTDTKDLVPLPLNKSIIGSHWAYKIKIKSHGSIERYKARLVAKGFSQQYVMDYEEPNALIIKMTTIHTPIVVSFIREWHITQLGVKNAFLNDDLQERVYMVLPPSVSHNL